MSPKIRVITPKSGIAMRVVLPKVAVESTSRNTNFWENFAVQSKSRSTNFPENLPFWELPKSPNFRENSGFHPKFPENLELLT